LSYFQTSLAIISVTVQLRIYVFLVISVYFNLRNILLKSGTFLLGHPVYIYTHIYVYNHMCIYIHMCTYACIIYICVCVCAHAHATYKASTSAHAHSYYVCKCVCVHVRFLCMWHGLGITCSPAL